MNLHEKYSKLLYKCLLFIEMYLEVCVFPEFSNTYLCNSKVKNEALKIRGQHLLSLAVLHIYIP